MKNTRIRASIETMTGYTPGEQPKIPGLIKLNTNENPYAPSPRVAEILRTLDPVDLRRYPDPVTQALRAQIAALHGCAVDQVFAGNGSDEVLALCTRAFVEDDQRMASFNPSYSLYPILAEIRKVPFDFVELPADFGWVRPTISAALFFLTQPNAPTGVCYPRDQVAEFCRQFPGVVLIDEAYVDFSEGHCLDLALSLPNVLVLRTLSKAYSLAGLRLGYVVGDRALIAALFKIKDSYNVDLLTQRIAQAALEDQETLRKNVSRIHATRERLAAGLQRLGFDVTPSQANFVWARPPRQAAKTVFEALRTKGVLVRYFPGPRTGDYLRITVGTDGEIDRLLVLLGEILAD
jgi:histidinol-phosphate aminotransferase